MEKNKKNEELQSRREFFKRAAKGALPILAVVALAGAPVVLNATTNTPMGCTGTCTNTCIGACKGCSTTCTGYCKNGCKGCSTTCTGGCKNYACKGVGKN